MWERLRSIAPSSSWLQGATSSPILPAMRVPLSVDPNDRAGGVSNLKFKICFAKASRNRHTGQDDE